MPKKYSVQFSQESLYDVQDAIIWYNQQQENLGERFRIELEFTIKTLSENPFHYQVKYNNIRMANFKVFPFAIHFELDEFAFLIKVISIFHFSRKPYWL